MRFSATPPHPSLCVCSQQDRYIPLFSPSLSPLNPFSGFHSPSLSLSLSLALFLTPPSSQQILIWNSPCSHISHTWDNDILLLQTREIWCLSHFYWFFCDLTMYLTCMSAPMMVSLPVTLPAGPAVYTWRALKAFKIVFWSNHCRGGVGNILLSKC